MERRRRRRRGSTSVQLNNRKQRLSGLFRAFPFPPCLCVFFVFVQLSSILLFHRPSVISKRKWKIVHDISNISLIHTVCDVHVRGEGDFIENNILKENETHKKWKFVKSLDRILDTSVRARLIEATLNAFRYRSVTAER